MNDFWNGFEKRAFKIKGVPKMKLTREIQNKITQPRIPKPPQPKPAPKPKGLSDLGI